LSDHRPGSLIAARRPFSMSRYSVTSECPLPSMSRNSRIFFAACGVFRKMLDLADLALERRV
jgi:hypothetical protein